MSTELHVFTWQGALGAASDINMMLCTSAIHSLGTDAGCMDDYNISISKVISGQLSASPLKVTRISPASSSSPHFSDDALPSRPHRMPNTSPHYLTS